MLNSLFEKLGLSDREVEIYLALLRSGQSTAGTVAKAVRSPRASIYDSLSILLQKGLVREGKNEGIKVWHAEPPDKIPGIVDQQISSWENEKRKFLKLLPDLNKEQAGDFAVPRFSYFEGAEGVKHVLRDMLLYRDLKTQAFWPISEMINVLGEDFFVELNLQRIRQNLYTEAIWPSSQVVDIQKYPFLGVGPTFRREIRIAPESIDCSMGYWAYGNKIAFISSRRETFGFIVESTEMRQMLKTQFDILWKLSKPINIKSKESEEFLKLV